MQKPVSATPPPEPENKCSGCLFMKLEAIPSQSEKQSQSTTTQINLHLTIQFNEQQEQLLEGRIKFGLKGGKLSVKLKNGKISLSSNHLSGSYKLAIQQERQQEKSENQSVDTSLSEGKLEGKTNPTPKNTTGRTDNIQFTTCQVTLKGSEEIPVWVIGVESTESVLKGLLKNALLATINVKAKPCYVEAIFHVLPQDVCLSEAEGIWPQNISKKRRLIIERAIVRHFFKRKLMPYLSRQQLRYD
jgi:hypothetical protein